MSRALIRTAILGHFRDVEAAAGTEHLRDSVATAMSASTQQGHGKGDSVEELRSAPEFGNERGPIIYIQIKYAMASQMSDHPEIVGMVH